LTDPQQTDPAATDAATAEQLMGIFMPYASQRRQELVARKGRFVHYTSAESALKIIRTKELWMRNTNCMSDFREVQHGADSLRAQPGLKNLIGILDKSFNGVGTEAAQLFDQLWVSTRLQTYVTSISEHDDNEDHHGRLSMWRAFGRSTARVALVLFHTL
jgi:hypothetical protein